MMRDVARFDRLLDEDWSAAPVFGVRPASASWVVRPSAYGLVSRDRLVLAVVRTSRGVYLPGGGIEAGETAQEAIRREALEECGLALEVGAWATRCVQFVYSEAEGTHFEKRSVFIECATNNRAGASAETDHELVWVSFDAAAHLLSQESHRWAVEQWHSRTSRR